MRKILAKILLFAATIFSAEVFAFEAKIDVQAEDSTAATQALINSGSTVVIPCGSIVNVTGLTVPATGATVRGECPSATLHVTSNAAAIYCAGSTDLNVYNLTITGTGVNYTGYGTGPSNLGQHGIHLNGCRAHVSGVHFRNLSGNGIDCENESFEWNAAISSSFTNIFGENNYRLIYTHKFCEYVNFSTINASNNVIGIEVESGNDSFSNVVARFNSIGVKINGQANQNPCHGTFSGGSVNHNTYDLVVVSCGFGQVFSGVDFIADQSGSIAAGSQGVVIYNSRGVTIANGQIGTNVALIAADPTTGSTSLNGANLLLNNYIRDDIPNFVPPSIGMGTSLLIKGNYNSSGLVGWNN